MIAGFKSTCCLRSIVNTIGPSVIFLQAAATVSYCLPGFTQRKAGLLKAKSVNDATY
jgi:hypothetical protein